MRAVKSGGRLACGSVRYGAVTSTRALIAASSSARTCPSAFARRARAGVSYPDRHGVAGNPGAITAAGLLGVLLDHGPDTVDRRARSALARSTRNSPPQ